ncbi:TonB-dependent receptor domain-containing protein [Agaribacter flavus]|uniref:TonB-dependent receptor domain-containing protein n=1 Tax=Agaribacter flavus TaxID=1902781 RepID=A0ABV7FNF9_9ALTE
MISKCKLSLVAIAILSSFHAYAQEATDANEEDKENADIEVINVKGFKGSLKKAINQKRFSSSIVDSIHAEDIGKSTDQNIGDALSRITGVSIQEADGEGTRISVRGAGADKNQISLNGVALTSGLTGSNGDAGFDQSVDLSSFSSDILSSIDVIKTPSADHDEGSLGANVILRTAKPLSVKKPIRSITIQGRYNDFSEESDEKISFSFSEKFLDDTVGILVTAATETQSTRNDTLFASYNEDEVQPLFRAGEARNLKTGQPTTQDYHVFTRTNNNYFLNLNQRDRKTATLGIEYIPFENTNIQLDLSHTKQEIREDRHGLRFNTNLADGGPEGQDGDPFVDWYTINTDTNVLVKNTSRRVRGSMNRGIGGKDLETNVATLKITQDFSDTFRMDLTAGYSKTTDNTVRNIDAGTGTWFTLPGDISHVDGADVQPAGYDCSGGPCTIVFGDAIASLPPGTSSERAIFLTETSFNPFDLHIHHLSGLNMYNNDNTDINKSLFVDFDWDVDWGPVTTIEFGYKASAREKDVLIDRQSLTGTAVPVFNEEGQEVFGGSEPQTIRVTEFLSSDAFPVNNFLNGVTAEGFPLSSGWGLIDPEKALSIAFNLDNVSLIPNPAGSNYVKQDNQSAYLKFNFSLMDSRLTGNVGLRYVETDIESRSFTTVNYNNSNNVLVPYDLVYRKQLANTSLPNCNTFPELPVQTGGCYQPLVTHLFDGRMLPDFPDNWQPVYDENGILQNPFSDEHLLQVTYDDAGNVVSIDRNDPLNTHPDFDNYSGPRSEWRLRAWTDNTTNRVDVPFLNKFTGAEIAQNWQRNFATSGASDNSVLLPSLNVNYALNDEVILRFAASRTMARPRFNAVVPGAFISENIWGERGRGSAGSAELVPLKSNNLDFSFEWYFDDTGLASIALFRKDMKDFLQRVNDVFYYKDIREQYDIESIEVSDLLIAPNGQTPADGCSPERFISRQNTGIWRFGCHEVDIGVERNGKKTVTQGFELSYVDTFSELPGAFSGLGVQLNYTFQDSENDPEFIENTGTFLAPLPQAFTPRHSANATVFWEKDGIELRLANRYTGIQFVSESRTIARWRDETNRLDFSANYDFNEHLSFSFHALNLTDDTTRSFITSKALFFGELDANGERVLLDEGNPQKDSSVDTSKVYNEFKTGRQYRLSVRVTF